MTKILCLASLLALISGSAHAASLQLNPEQSLSLVEGLLLAGAKADTSKPIYKIELSNLSCKIRNVSHAGSPEDLLWGMSEFECTNPAGKGAKAKVLVNVLDAIEAAYQEKITITDCAMGKCFASLKKVSCTINSNEVETEKRFACEIVDTQE